MFTFSLQIILGNKILKRKWDIKQHPCSLFQIYYYTGTIRALGFFEDSLNLVPYDHVT